MQHCIGSPMARHCPWTAADLTSVTKVQGCPMPGRSSSAMDIKLREETGEVRDSHGRTGIPCSPWEQLDITWQGSWSTEIPCWRSFSWGPRTYSSYPYPSSLYLPSSLGRFSQRLWPGRNKVKNEGVECWQKRRGGGDLFNCFLTLLLWFYLVINYST